MNPGLELLRIYIKFLDRLSPADLKALETGLAGLALIHKKGRAMGRKSAEPSTAWLREKIEGQKKASGNRSLAWLNKYRKDSLWRLIESYRETGDWLSGEQDGPSAYSAKRVMIEYLEQVILNKGLNKIGIADINLDF